MMDLEMDTVASMDRGCILYLDGVGHCEDMRARSAPVIIGPRGSRSERRSHQAGADGSAGLNEKISTSS